MVRKQQRPKRAPVSCESETGQEDDFGSEKGGYKPMKGKALKDMTNGTETEERKGNEASEIGDENGKKVEKCEGEGEGEGGERGNQKEILDLECKKEKESGESENIRRVNLCDKCEFMGGDGNGASEEKIKFDENSSSLRRRLRGGGKKMNYIDYEFVEEIDGTISGKRRKRSKGGLKRKKSKADEVQVNNARKEGNEGVNMKKKRGQRSRKDENVKEGEVLKSVGGEGEGNEVRRIGPKKLEEKLEESAGSLDCVEQEKNTSQRDEVCRYSLRASRNRKEQLVRNDSKKKVNDKLKISLLLW